MRSEVLKSIHEFNSGERSVEQLKLDFVDFIKYGVENELTAVESKEFRRLFSGWIDMYDSKLQPRPGVIGYFHDLWDQVFFSKYRISMSELRQRTKRFETFLKK